MSRLLALLAVAVACGSSSQPARAPSQTSKTSQTSQTSGAKASPSPAAAAPGAKPSEADDDGDGDTAETNPPAPGGPVEVKIAAGQTTVKLVSDGAGKKQPLRYSTRPGARQAVELALDFTGREDSDEVVNPTLVFAGQAEARSVDKDGGADITLTVTGVDVRAVPGAKRVEEFKGALGKLTGLTIGSKRSAVGDTGDITLRIENPPHNVVAALELIRLTFPTLPIVPAQPVGVGAKWQSITATRLADKLAVTQVTDYELIGHDGPSWRIRGTTRITGKNQDIDGAKASDISGAGTSETTITDGALYPAHKASLQTQFTLSDGNRSTQFVLVLGGTVTMK